jgi:monovalent cation:H+ antiporter, CPA1 family
LKSPATHSLVTALRSVPSLSGLDEDALLELVGTSSNLFWRAGSPLFAKGDAGDALYVVLAGSISVRDGGNEVRRIGTGDYLGERALLRDEPRSLDAVAAEDSELLVLPKDAVARLLEDRPDVAASIRERLAEVEAHDASRGAASPGG